MESSKRICSRCIMDSSDPNIKFDENNVCDYCLNFEKNIKPSWNNTLQNNQILSQISNNIRLEGKNKEAYEIHFKLIEIINLIFTENNPAGIKTVLQELNITSDEVRLPLVKTTSKLQKEITNFVTNF